MGEFKKHPWFADVEFDQLMKKEIQPPFVPDFNRTNFDVSHELDEFLMVEKTLTHSQRKKNVDVDKMKPEYRALEEQFTVYDSTRPQRTSYYPHNQPIVVGKGESESFVIPSATNTVVPNQTYLERSTVRTSVLVADRWIWNFLIDNRDHPSARGWLLSLRGRITGSE